MADITYIRNKKEFGSKNSQFEILVLFLWFLFGQVS